MKGISLILCCYNSAKRLWSTLDFISKQKVERDIAWEIIIVDNNSTDNTGHLAIEFWKKLGSLAPLSVIFEPNPGLSFARSTGLFSSQYDYVILCDDDNWLSSNYISYVYSFFEQNPTAGILGGKGIPYLEGQPPSWFESFREAYAVSPRDEVEIETLEKRDYVFGAGMAIRKESWNILIGAGFKSLLTDRKGNSLSSGGDTELCYAFELMSYQTFYSTSISFQHFIPMERLTLDYFFRLQNAFVKSRIVLELYKMKSSELQRNFYWSREIFYFLRKDFIKLILIFLSEKRMTPNWLYARNRLFYFKEFFLERTHFNNSKTIIMLLKMALDAKT